MVDGETFARVPYIYCSHSRSDLGDSCLTRDFGADSGERMKNILDDLDTWYITRSFPRGQIGASTYRYVVRYYGRVYNRLKKWHDLYGLYHGLFSQFFDPADMEQFLTDPETGWGAKTWAVQNAFNYLVRTVLMPDIGGYGGPWNPGDDNNILIPVGGQPMVDLGVTDARYFSTSWQNPEEECGYFWWECLHHVGSYVDKIMAIEALSDSTTNFVARATPKDLREWEVSYYSTFAEQIGKINAAILGGDWSKVGPYYDAADGKMHWPNYAGGLYESHSQMGIIVQQAPIDPSATFTVQLFWQVLGMARFMNNFDQSFRDESRIFVLGSAAAPDVAEEQLVLFTDPVGGLTYGALRYGTTSKGGGQATLDRANRFISRSNFCDKKGLTPQTADDCDPQLQGDVNAQVRDILDARLLDHLEKIKVMADLAPLLSHGNPYSL